MQNYTMPKTKTNIIDLFRIMLNKMTNYFFVILFRYSFEYDIESCASGTFFENLNFKSSKNCMFNDMSSFSSYFIPFATMGFSCITFTVYFSHRLQRRKNILPSDIELLAMIDGITSEKI